MSTYLLRIEFASPLCVDNFSGTDVPSSVGADRVFSWICLGWSTLFGASDLEQEIISPFLAGKNPWVHSNLFACDDQYLYVPAIENTDDDNALELSYRISLSDSLHPADSPKSVKMKEVRPQLASVRIGRIRAHELNSDKEKTTVLKKSLFNAIGQNHVEGSKQADTLQLGALFQFESNPTAILAKLHAVFSYLKDEGLGAMRSAGAGEIRRLSFTSIEAPSKVQTFPHSQADSQAKFNSALERSESSEARYLLLSTCCPDEVFISEIISSQPATNIYGIQRSSGWIYDSQGQNTATKKAHSFSFSAGSIFSCHARGRLLDISSNSHPCYRYGIPFCIPIQ